MITRDAVSVPPYRITGVSPGRHTAAHDFAEACVTNIERSPMR
jgi:hypothetical protein